MKFLNLINVKARNYVVYELRLVYQMIVHHVYIMDTGWYE